MLMRPSRREIHGILCSGHRHCCRLRSCCLIVSKRSVFSSPPNMFHGTYITILTPQGKLHEPWICPSSMLTEHSTWSDIQILKYSSQTEFSRWSTDHIIGGLAPPSGGSYYLRSTDLLAALGSTWETKASPAHQCRGENVLVFDALGTLWK